MSEAPPFERFYDLGDLSDAGDEVAISLSPADLARLAGWADVRAVERFAADISLARLASNRFGYDATLVADIVQTCVVTLEPVSNRIERRFRRVLLLAPGRRHQAPGGEIALTAADDDAPEEIASTRFDLAAPLLEEFLLAIDPYPRAPGVEFQPPAGDDKPESPFAKLKTLKIRD